MEQQKPSSAVERLRRRHRPRVAGKSGGWEFTWNQFLVWAFWFVILFLSVWIPLSVRNMPTLPVNVSQRIYDLHVDDLVLTRNVSDTIFVIQAQAARYTPESATLAFVSPTIESKSSDPAQNWSAKSDRGYAVVTPTSGLLPQEFKQVELAGRVTVTFQFDSLGPGESVLDASHAIYVPEERGMKIPGPHRVRGSQGNILDFPDPGYLDLELGRYKKAK